MQGTTHPLALVEGASENASLVTEQLVDLRKRGLDVTRPILACLDGATALHRAVTDVFDFPVLQRCQQHKIRNVRDKLPQRLRPVAERRMRADDHADSALEAEALLTALARELEKTHGPALSGLIVRRPARPGRGLDVSACPPYVPEKHKGCPVPQTEPRARGGVDAVRASLSNR